MYTNYVHFVFQSGSETFHRIIHKYNRYYEIVGGLDLLNIFEQQNQ